MKTEELLKNGLQMIELEERLEMVQLASASVDAAASWSCCFDSSSSDNNVKADVSMA